VGEYLYPDNVLIWVGLFLPYFPDWLRESILAAALLTQHYHSSTTGA
jgi:hypothetical protein